MAQSDDFDADWAGYYREADERSAQVRTRLRHRSHIRYGPHPRQLVNVLHPSHEAAGSPAALFFHGGAWREGHPDHYDHLAELFARHGVTFVSAGYRLRPDFEIPDSTEDAATAAAWVHRHLGGRRLVLIGHSAGATMSASLAVRNDWCLAHGLDSNPVVGLAGVSGDYDLVGRTDLAGDADALASIDPFRAMTRTPDRAVLAFGTSEANRKGADRTRYRRSGRALAAALEGAGCRVRVIELKGIDHAGTARSIGDRQGPLAAAIQDLVA